MNPIELKIVFDPRTHRCQVLGPVDDVFLCHGLLGLGLKSLQEHWARQAEGKRVLVPTPIIDPDKIRTGEG